MNYQQIENLAGSTVVESTGERTKKYERTSVTAGTKHPL